VLTRDSMVLRAPPPRRAKRRAQALVLDDDSGHGGNLRRYVSPYLLSTICQVQGRIVRHLASGSRPTYLGLGGDAGRGCFDEVYQSGLD
jgi:hypothetical protein